MEIKHLFILAQNSSGSGILHRTIAGCKNATDLGRLEGAGVAKKHMTHFSNMNNNKMETFSTVKDKIMEEDRYNWSKVKECWNRNWDQSKPIKIEKTTHSLYYCDMLEREFNNAHFIIMVRNPLAVVEAINRRDGVHPTKALQHWLECTKRQIRNTKYLKRVIWFNYQSLCNGEQDNKIKEFIPELIDFSSKNLKCMNNKKDRLSKATINDLRKTLEENKDIVSYFFDWKNI